MSKVYENEIYLSRECCIEIWALVDRLFVPDATMDTEQKSAYGANLGHGPGSLTKCNPEGKDMTDGQGANAQGAAGQNPNGNNGQGNGSQGASGQGSEAPSFVTKADFEAFTSRFETFSDTVLKDNHRYRQERRQGSNQGSQGVNQNGNNESGNNGQGNGSNNVSAEVETLRQELRTERFRNDIISAAQAAGALNPSRIPQLLDMEELADEKGNVRNAARALEALSKSDPYLFGKVVQGGADGGSGNGNNNGTQPKTFNQMIREKAKR